MIKEINKLKEPPRIAVKFANIFFVLGIFFCLLTSVYASYRIFNPAYVVYLGNVLQTASSSTVNTQPLVEYFDSDGTAQTVSLGRTPPTAGSIAVYLDGVFQRGGSGKAYTLSGGAITFTGATPAGGSDNITVFHLATEDNRVTNQVAAGAVTNAKLNLDYSNSNYRAPTVDASFASTTKTIKSASATVNYGVNDILGRYYMKQPNVLTMGEFHNLRKSTLTIPR